jgi:hypothetical protein
MMRNVLRKLCCPSFLVRFETSDASKQSALHQKWITSKSIKISSRFLRSDKFCQKNAKRPAPETNCVRCRSTTFSGLERRQQILSEKEMVARPTTRQGADCIQCRERICSGLSRSGKILSKRNAARPVAAERLASGAEFYKRRGKICSGVERSDLRKRKGRPATGRPSLSRENSSNGGRKRPWAAKGSVKEFLENRYLCFQ